ncbi:MAG: cobalt-precorrin-5B (C(1))-methyltransferase [Anaeromyxobacteraceae bacterium]
MTELATNAPGLRTGFTTGACAAAAARAAARYAITGERPWSVAITLPNGSPATFAIARAERRGATARCAVVKDGGDDPDATHGAEIVAEVELADAAGVEIRGGEGVAVVTRPGLGLELGAPAINPVPRRNIAEMVAAELAAWGRAGARVTVSVPHGAELARATLNPRLGLVGGISILGTTGVVRPFSTRAWQASVAAAIDVACASGVAELVFTTGGRTEAHAMRLWPALAEGAFIQVGDAMGAALRHASLRGAARVEVVAMVGKMSKLGAGALAIHASDAAVDLAYLSAVTHAAGGGGALCAGVLAANTAREALELWRGAGVERAAGTALCRDVARRCAAAAPGVLVRATLVGFEGELLARAPGEA